jgi:hypothetical protein
MTVIHRHLFPAKPAYPTAATGPEDEPLERYIRPAVDRVFVLAVGVRPDVLPREFTSLHGIYNAARADLTLVRALPHGTPSTIWSVRTEGAAHLCSAIPLAGGRVLAQSPFLANLLHLQRR